MQNDIGEYIKKNLKFFSNPIRAKKAGLPPGTLTYTGEITDKMRMLFHMKKEKMVLKLTEVNLCLQ